MPKNSTNTSAKLIGIAGLPRSGKDTLAELLVRSGYYGVSLGDIIREVSKKRHAGSPEPISIENMTETANWLRKKHGPDFALKIALNRFEEAAQHKEYEGLVVYSIRAPIEADFIHENGGALVWVEAADDTRYQRYLDFLRGGEQPIGKALFLKREKIQWQPQKGTDTSIQMDIRYVKQHADTILDNSGSLEDFLATAAVKLGFHY